MILIATLQGKMCFYSIPDICESAVSNFEDDLEAFEEFPPSPIPIVSVPDEETEEDEENIDPDPMPWEVQAESNFEFYLENLFNSPDICIVEFYEMHYPDMAMPIVSKGLDFKYFIQAVVLSQNHDIPICFRRDVPIHLKGQFFTKETDNSFRYCLDCIDFFEPDDFYIAYRQHYADKDGLSFETEMCNPYTSYKYFCQKCDKFLFTVDDFDELCCDECNNVNGYEEDGGKRDITDMIDYYYRIA